ncbi:hypothetical protein Tco_0825765 [Tanacetum coccineum]
MVDEFAHPKFFASVRGMEHDHLFTEFNVGATHQMSLSAEVREGENESLKAQLALKEAEAAEAIRLRAEASNFKVVEKSLQDEMNALKERNAIFEKQQNALDVKVTDLEASAMRKKRELTDLNSLITSVHKLEISSSRLQEKVTVYENCMEQLEKFQDNRMKFVDEVIWHLDVDSSYPGMAFHVEEKFYPHLLTTISGRRWLLTQGMELAIIKCLNSPKYVSALGAPIGKAIEKGMQDGLSTGITHGKEGRVLMDVFAHNPSEEDASIEDVMDILRLEGPLADKLGLDELQPNVDQLMVPFITRRTKLLLVPPLCMGGTSDIVSVTTDTTTALSITFASTSLIDPISVDDYEVIGVYDQAVTDGNAASFPNVDDAELNIIQ